MTNECVEANPPVKWGEELKMRIGIIKWSFTPYGGAETFLGRFIGALVKRGHTIDVFSESWPEAEGVRVHLVNSSGSRSARPKSFAQKAGRSSSMRLSPRCRHQPRDDRIVRIYTVTAAGATVSGSKSRTPVRGRLKKLATSLSPFHKTMLKLEERVFSDTRLKGS